MRVHVLELFPSPSGWYYPFAPAREAPSPRLPHAPPVVRSLARPTSAEVLGYGADGRIRLSPPDARISMLA